MGNVRKLFSVAKSSPVISYYSRSTVCKSITNHHIKVNQIACYSQALGSFTKDQAHDLVYRMNDEERVILMRELERFNVATEKRGLECKYAQVL